MRSATNELLDVYERELASPCPTGLRKHALGMIVEMRGMRDAVKLNRWLGFLQGMMFALKLRTIEQLRDETRGAVHDEFMEGNC